MWKNFYCTNTNCRAFLGLQNSASVIYGGILIKQPQTRILCRRCSRIRRDSWRTDSHILRLLSEGEIAAILIRDGYEPDEKTDYLKTLDKNPRLK